MNGQPPPPPPNGGSGFFGDQAGGPPPGGPGGFAYGQFPIGPVNNHMAMAILVTIFCCLPFGIVAIVNAAQVNKKIAIGDYNGAIASSKQAKTWATVSLVTGVVVVALWILIVIVVGA
jgi:hypothetical protein